MRHLTSRDIDNYICWIISNEHSVKFIILENCTKVAKRNFEFKRYVHKAISKRITSLLVTMRQKNL